MTPAEQEVLREIGAYLGALGEDLAQSVEATAETTVLVESAAGSLGRIEDALEALTKKFLDLCEEQSEINKRLNLYLQDATQAETGMRQLRSEVRRVDERLRLVEGGGGQR